VRNPRLDVFVIAAAGDDGGGGGALRGTHLDGEDERGPGWAEKETNETGVVIEAIGAYIET
jgi:hypothetical protein